MHNCSNFHKPRCSSHNFSAFYHRSRDFYWVIREIFILSANSDDFSAKFSVYPRIGAIYPRIGFGDFSHHIGKSPPNPSAQASDPFSDTKNKLLNSIHSSV